MLKNSLIRISIAPFVLLVVHIFATLGGWYEIWWWFDIPMHFLGGVAVAFSGYHLLQDFSKRNLLAIEFTPLKILTIMSFTALAAVSWEFFEFSLDTYVNTNMQPGIVDTIKDLAIGISGGGIVGTILTLRNGK